MQICPLKTNLFLPDNQSQHMKNFLGFIALAVLIFGCAALAQDEKKTSTTDLPQEQLDSMSYAIGVSISENLEKQGYSGVNYNEIAKGIEEGIKGTSYVKGMEAQQLIQRIRGAQMKLQAEANLVEAEAYLEKKKSEKDVQSTPSGLAYKVIKEGTGAQPEGPTSKVTVHYHGTLPDGTVFDSSKQKGKPYTTALNAVIKGWTEGVQLMKEGAIYEFYIHPDLAYGANPRPGVIKPNNALVFEVELISVN